MRRRLLVTYLTLTAVLLLGTEIPLGYSLAMNNYHHLAMRKQSETLSLASAAEPDLASTQPGLATPGGAWATAADAYSREHDTVVMLFDADGRLLHTTSPGAQIDHAQWRDTLDRALAGQAPAPLDYSFNIGAQPLFVAGPVLEQGEPVGAVATISPTESLRTRVAGESLVLGGVAIAGLLAAMLLTIPLVRWGFGPAHQLHAAARKIAHGEYSVRARTDQGPVELRDLAEAFNTMTDRLTSILAAQRSFVTDASHQLRNPLTALRVRVEALEQVVPAHGRADLAVAIAEADRLSRILDELLALASASAADYRTSTVEVRSVVESRARVWSGVAERSEVTIAVTGERAAARCLPGALDQVLDVLLDNAIGFSPPGGRVVIRTRADETRVYVEVADQGPGMPASDQDHAADRFWRGRQPAGRHGSGLGLAIAKTLLTASDGQLEFADAQPRGLVARAVLPRVTGPALHDPPQ
jgi:signal transduction histidine kinase